MSPEFLGDELQGVVPVDRPVVGSALVQDHRMGQPSLLSQPVVVACLQVRNGMPGEELGPHPAAGSFLGHGLGAVLAELRGIAFFVFRPGTAHAVESVDLVDRHERLDAAQRAHLLQGNFQRVGHGGDADGLGFGFADSQP